MTVATGTHPAVPPGRLSTPFRLAAGAAAALGADVAFDPVHRHVPLCPFHALTGWWCPLCGGLRAADRLAHGNVVAALHDNTLLVASIPLLLLFWLDAMRRARAGRPARRMPRAVAVAAVVIAAGFTVLRNLPFAGALRP
jgi:Protein of unknown function (DUF2752)